MRIVDALLSKLVEDATVQDIRVGPFWTAVISRGCGLAATTLDQALPHGEPAVCEAGRLCGRSAREVAALALSPRLLEVTIGVAAINSLLPVDESRCVELNAADLLAEQGKGRRVAIVGHFPFVSRLRHVANELWVIEKRPREGDLTADEAEAIIPKADVVAITGSALVNGTIDGLLALCDPKSLVVVLGPSTPLSPVLFDYGVDVISGSHVVDPISVLRCLSEGAIYPQLSGVRRLTMQR